MGLFIEVEIDRVRCVGIEECGRCITVCPVNIFEEGDDRPKISPENEDECTLCDLCLKECRSGAITIKKRY